MCNLIADSSKEPQAQVVEPEEFEKVLRAAPRTRQFPLLVLADQTQGGFDHHPITVHFLLFAWWARQDSNL